MRYSTLPIECAITCSATTQNHLNIFHHKLLKLSRVSYSLPFVEHLKRHKQNAFFGILVVGIQAAIVSLFYLYVTAFMQLQDHSSGNIAYVTIVNLIIFSIFCVIGGFLSDSIGQKTIIFLCTLALIPIGIWFYHSLTSHQHVMLSYLLVSIVSGGIAGTISAYLTKVFPTSIRYTGVAFCYNVGFAIFGGLTPAIATFLIHPTNNPIMPGYLMSIICVIGILGLLITQQVSKTLSNA